MIIAIDRAGLHTLRLGEVDYKECMDGVRDGVCGLEFVGIWSVSVNLLMTMECVAEFVDINGVQRSIC
jgi:hypothetical protein